MSESRKIPKAFIFGTIGIMIPAVIIAIAVLAIQSDAKNKEEYDRLRAEQAQRIAERDRVEALKKESAAAVQE